MIEHKFAGAGDFAVADDRTVSGYASVFGHVDLGGDTVLSGAYTKTLQAIEAHGGLSMRLEHSRTVIGRWKRLEEDQKGLRVIGELTPNHSIANDIYASLKAGHMGGLSIGYVVQPGGSKRRSDGVRELRGLDLVEISVVADPMDPRALIDGVKAVDMEQREIRDLIRNAMRDAGVQISRTEVEAFMGGGFKAMTAMRDAGGLADADARAFLEGLRA